ncbi:MAG: hypothetical protein HUN04_04510 [Desulfobacter sp.]|nr:MAG: hypothetical protein HUN04_04510 [Desulfobacter sp.]
MDLNRNEIPADIELGDMVEYMRLNKEGKSPDEIRKILADKRQSASTIMGGMDIQDRQHFKIGEYEEIYDPGFGKVMTVGHVERFYGKDILAQLKKEQKESLLPGCERNENHVSPELYHRMKKMVDDRSKRRGKSDIPGFNPGLRIIEKEKPTSTLKKEEPKIDYESIPQKSSQGDTYFLKTRRGMVRNEKYRELFKGPGTVYEWLWSNIARGQWKDTKEYPIKEKYYDRGYLVYCTTYSQIAKHCGMAKSTVIKYINSFVDAGIVRVENLKPKGKKQGQSVFILGEWKLNPSTGKPDETYYREIIFMMPGKEGHA